MKNLLLLLLSTFSFTFLFGQQPYYDDVNLELIGMDLKTELSNKITNTHTHNLSYSQVWSALKIMDLNPEGGNNVLLMYGYDDDDGNVTTDRTRNKSNNGGDNGEWNREHTYPKALGQPNLGTSGPGADAHMLRPCDVQRNSQRGSKRFNVGSGHSGVVSSFYWYPGDEWKGDIARMMMYMYLRYGDQCLPKNVGIGTPVENDADMIDLFLQWNIEDPVSAFEETRNDYMGNASNTYAQGNRNPFIDNPYLATLIWGGDAAEDIWDIFVSVEAPILEKFVQISPNPSKGSFSIQTTIDLTIESITLYTTSGQVVQHKNYPDPTIVTLETSTAGLYFLQLVSDKGIVMKKIIIE